MSKYLVRHEVRAELQTLGAIGAFIDTINKPADPGTNDPWFSVEFYTDYEDPLCFDGKAYAEHGTFDVSIYSKAGTGDQVVTQAADALIAHFQNWTKGSIEVTGVLGPQEIFTGDAEGNYYGVTVSISYVYRY